MDMPANSIFSGPITHQLSMLFMKIFLHASVEKKKKLKKEKKKRGKNRLKGFEYFYQSFSSDTVAVMG